MGTGKGRRFEGAAAFFGVVDKLEFYRSFIQYT